MGTEREAEAAGRSLRTPANQEGGGLARAGGLDGKLQSFITPAAAQLHSNTFLTLPRTPPLKHKLELGPGESPSQLWPLKPRQEQLPNCPSRRRGWGARLWGGEAPNRH